MNNKSKWIQRRLHLAFVFLLTSIATLAVGITLELGAESLPFDARSVTAFGILLLGVAIAFLTPYFQWRRNPEAATRLANQAQDERYRMIRARAGNRAYWASLVIACLGLTYISTMLGNMVPVLSTNTLWYYMTALVALPYLVYATSYGYDEKHL